MITDRIIDSDNTNYEIELTKTTKLRDLSALSSIPVIIESEAVRIPRSQT